jgi:hypothetical protein
MRGNYLLLIAFFLLCWSKAVDATTMGNIEIYEDKSKFVQYPAKAGTVVGGVVGAVVGVPVAVIGGVVSLFTTPTLEDAVSFGFWGSVISFAMVGHVIFGAPFWGVEELCCSGQEEPEPQPETVEGQYK